jgi:hypothetical protein
MDEWNSFLWVSLAPEVVERSLEIADAFALRGSDSVHLASALQLRGDLGIDCQRVHVRHLGARVEGCGAHGWSGCRRSSGADVSIEFMRRVRK